MLLLNRKAMKNSMFLTLDGQRLSRTTKFIDSTKFKTGLAYFPYQAGQAHLINPKICKKLAIQFS